jgi:hypothetical protein
VSNIGQPDGSGDPEQAGNSEQSMVPAGPGSLMDATATDTAWRAATVSARISHASGMDTVDACRMRLLALRTRIETNWPQRGGALFNRDPGLGPQANADISSLLIALPTPLPLQAGGEPEAIVRETDTDMCEVAGRAVDAGLALLEGATLETIYPGHVKMLEDYHPNSPEPITVANPTVGVLVAMIIGTLDAVSEIVLASATPGMDAMGKLLGDGGASIQKALTKLGRAMEAAPPHPAPPKRGRSVPRI